MESNLLKEAIADAKAVRQTALANAKVALEEAFSERYHAMFAEKLKEDAAGGDVAPAAPAQDMSAQENVSEQEIDELIKELEAEVGAPAAPEGSDDVDGLGAGAPAAPAFGGAPVAPAGPVAPPFPPVPGAVPPGCPPPMGGFPGAFPGVAPVPPLGEPLPPSGAPPMPPMDAGMGAPAPAPVGAPPSDVPAPEGEDADEDVNLDELLESLKEEVDDNDEDDETKKLDEEKKLASSGIGGKAGGSDNKKPASGANSSSNLESGGIKQQGMPSPDGTKVGPDDATTAKRPNEAKNATSTNLSTPSLGGSSGPALKAARPNSKGDFENTAKLNEENVSLKKQLTETEDTLRYVKGQLNEINLLNAKLLYTNKLFKEFSMNNEQKMRIVEMFDLSKNVREVKLTYANIAESLNFSGTDIRRKAKSSAGAQSITEGLASQPVGSTKPSRDLISEGKANQMVTRFQQIAGIKPAKK